MKNITIYTDGACSGNPGAGGWACILIYGENKKELSGGEELTTNNRMELLGVINGLEALQEKCHVDIYSDSAYVVNAFNQNWIDSWINNDWKTKAKSPVQNVDLWERLINLTKKHDVVFNKVKGHSDVELNNRCDELARNEVQKFKKTID